MTSGTYSTARPPKSRSNTNSSPDDRFHPEFEHVMGADFTNLSGLPERTHSVRLNCRGKGSVLRMIPSLDSDRGGIRMNGCGAPFWPRIKSIGGAGVSNK